MKKKSSVIISGLIVGIAAVCLGLLGNPANMALCVACFIRDTAGALGLHRAEAVQYIRPEITGIVLGAFIISVYKKEYSPKAGSSPFTRFVLGVCVMVGALIFLGCPLRMVLRIAGGDLNAAVGLVGFACGILSGIFFLNRGFSLGRSYAQPAVEGPAFTIINIAPLILLFAAPSLIFFSESGPGAMHAPALAALAGGLVVGIAAQRTRICFIGGVRDAFLFKDFHMLLCFLSIFVTVLLGNVLTGRFMPGFYDRPIAHTEWFWNIAGLYLVGLASVLLGGCPLRQLVMAGGGNGDAGVTVLGYFFGAALCHNLGLASSASGTTANGRVAFVICVITVIAIAVANIKKTGVQE